MKRKNDEINHSCSPNRGSVTTVFLFSVILCLMCFLFFVWMQENPPEDPPKETKPSFTVNKPKPSATNPTEANPTETSPVATKADTIPPVVPDAQAQQAAAAAQASMEAAIAEANRIAAEAEVARKAAEAAKAAAEAEAAKIAAEAEAAKKAAEEEAAKRAAAEEAARKAAEAEVAKKAAEEETARKAAEQTQPAVKFYDNMKVLDAKEHIMHSPKCELVNSIAEEDKQIVEAGIFDLQVQGYMICEHCWAGLMDSDSVPVPENPSIGIANLRGE